MRTAEAELYLNFPDASGKLTMQKIPEPTSAAEIEPQGNQRGSPCLMRKADYCKAGIEERRQRWFSIFDMGVVLEK